MAFTTKHRILTLAFASEEQDAADREEENINACHTSPVMVQVPLPRTTGHEVFICDGYDVISFMIHAVAPGQGDSEFAGWLGGSMIGFPFSI